MKKIENKISPPVFTLVIAARMWGTEKLQSPISLEPTFRIALLLALYATALVFGVGG